MTLRGVYSNGTVNHNNDTKKLLFFGYCTSFLSKSSTVRVDPSWISPPYIIIRCLRLLSKLRTLIVGFFFFSPFQWWLHSSSCCSLNMSVYEPTRPEFPNTQIHQKKPYIEPQWSGLTNGRISLPESPSCHQITPTNPFCQEQDETPGCLCHYIPLIHTTSLNRIETTKRNSNPD